jgi:hypothetical protein
LTNLSLYYARLSRAQQFQGFRLLESVKTTIQGIPTLLMSHEFTLGGEAWNCLMVLRVSGQAIWYADASGLLSGHFKTGQWKTRFGQHSLYPAQPWSGKEFRG